MRRWCRPTSSSSASAAAGDAQALVTRYWPAVASVPGLWGRIPSGWSRIMTWIVLRASGPAQFLAEESANGTVNGTPKKTEFPSQGGFLMGYYLDAKVFDRRTLP